MENKLTLLKTQGVIKEMPNVCIVIRIVNKDLTEKSLTLFFNSDHTWNEEKGQFRKNTAEFVMAYASGIARNDKSALGYKAEAYAIDYIEGKGEMRLMIDWNPQHITKFS